MDHAISCHSRYTALQPPFQSVREQEQFDGQKERVVTLTSTFWKLRSIVVPSLPGFRVGPLKLRVFLKALNFAVSEGRNSLHRFANETIVPALSVYAIVRSCARGGKH